MWEIISLIGIGPGGRRSAPVGLIASRYPDKLLARAADLFLPVGTTGEILPVSMIPRLAKSHGATIVEINPASSAFTGEITDVHLRAPATEALHAALGWDEDPVRSQ